MAVSINQFHIRTSIMAQGKDSRGKRRQKTGDRTREIEC
jgi:hypothetical protein